MPEVSVLIPAFNAARSLPAALNSVLAQTFEDFEVLVIDDASTDETRELVDSFRDERIRRITNEANLGVAASLNRGLEAARGDLVARLDADDTARPQRLQRQVDAFRRRPDLGALGAWMRIRSPHLRGVLRQPSGAETVRGMLLFDNPLHHPAVMLRRSILEEHGLSYSSTFSRSEDYHLWIRLAEVAALDNLPEVLVDFTISEQGVTGQHGEEMQAQVRDLQAAQLNELELPTDEGALRLHSDAGHGRALASLEELERAGLWMFKVADAAQALDPPRREGVCAAASFVWERLCRNNSCLGPGVAALYTRVAPRGACRPVVRGELAMRGLLNRMRQR